MFAMIWGKLCEMFATEASLS